MRLRVLEGGIYICLGCTLDECAPVAQRPERQPCKLLAAGSNPARGFTRHDPSPCVSVVSGGLVLGVVFVFPLFFGVILGVR